MPASANPWAKILYMPRLGAPGNRLGSASASRRSENVPPRRRVTGHGPPVVGHVRVPARVAPPTTTDRSSSRKTGFVPEMFPPIDSPGCPTVMMPTRGR